MKGLTMPQNDVVNQLNEKLAGGVASVPDIAARAAAKVFQVCIRLKSGQPIAITHPNNEQSAASKLYNIATKAWQEALNGDVKLVELEIAGGNGNFTILNSDIALVSYEVGYVQQ